MFPFQLLIAALGGWLHTPDTILRWHRELVARKWTYRAGCGRPIGLQARLRALIIRTGQRQLGRRRGFGGSQIEDDVLVGGDGPTILTSSISIEEWRPGGRCAGAHARSKVADAIVRTLRA